jgi:hypothetical protein
VRDTFFVIALLIVLVFGFVLFVAAFSTPVHTPIEINGYEYAFNLSRAIDKVIFGGLPALALAAVLLWINVFLRRNLAPPDKLDKLSIILLAILLFLVGFGLDLYMLALDRILVGHGRLPKGSAFLMVDMTLVLIPPLLLSQILLGRQLRKLFLITLPVIVVISLALKFLYAASHMKMTF